MSPHLMRRSAVQWQVSLVRGLGQYFIEIMDSSEDSDWGPVFSFWNLLMVLLFGFLTKKIYDCFGTREQEKTPSDALAASSEGTTGSSEGSGDSSEATRGSSEVTRGAAEKSALQSDKDGTQGISLDKQGAGLLKDASGKTLGTGDGTSVDQKSGTTSGEKDSAGAGKDGKDLGKDLGKDGTEKVSIEKGAGLRSQPGAGATGQGDQSKGQDAASGIIGSGSETSVDRDRNLGGAGKDGIEKITVEKDSGLRSQPGGGTTGGADQGKGRVEDVSGKEMAAGIHEKGAEKIIPERAETMATGRAAGAGIGLTGELKDKVEEIADELKSETDDIEKAWMREQEQKRKMEEEERKKKAEEEERERKRKEEEEKKKKEEEKKQKEEEEKKRKEEEEKKRKEEEERKRKEEEEKKRKEEEEKKRIEEEERKRKEEEEKERKRKEEEEKKKKEEEERKRKEEEEQERKRKEEEEKKKKEEEEEKERKRQEEEENKRKEEEERKRKEEEDRKKEEEERKKQEEELKKKEELARKAEDEKRKLEEEQAKKAEALRLAEEQLKKSEEDAKNKQKQAEDEMKRAEEELKREQEKVQAEIQRTEDELKSEPGKGKDVMKEMEEELKKKEEQAAEEMKKAEELGKEVDDLFNLDDDKSLEGKEENGNVETDYVMVSPPSSPLQQTVAPPPLPTVVKEENPQEVARKRQQVEDVMAVVGKDKHDSVYDLVDDLTVKQGKTTDFDKARALFIWLSSKDLKTLTFKSASPGSDEEKLTGLQEGDTTYAQVYQTLCRNAGLECELIHGYAKGVGYKPGMKFEGDGFRHSWNAVKVNGDWRLVDPNWGARHVVGKKDGSPEEEKEASDENTVYELDEYYFLPESWELIHSHFPDDPKWQLREPITKEQFENLVLCKSPFFKHNLRIASHCEAVIKVKKEAEVKIQCPDGSRDKLVFIFTLSYADSLNAAGDSYQGTPLGNFGMQRMVGNASSVVIRPPTPGEYRLVIHVKDLSKPQRVPGKFYYSEVCEYGVLVTEAHPSPRPFPPCAHSSWGKGDSMARYSEDLFPQAKDVIIPTKKGVAEVKFTLKKKLRFLAKLKSASLSDVDRHVIHRVVDDEAVFTIRPPENGEYGLEIYANDKEKDGTTMHHVYQYLIIAKDIKEKVEPWPQLPATFLGPQGNFSNFGMQIKSHKDPFIAVDKGSLTVEFTSPQLMKLMSQLMFVSGGNQEDMSVYVLQNTKEGSYSFHLELPRSGTYKFSLFGIPANAAGDNVPALYNCLLECRHGNKDAKPFPKQFSQWKNGGILNGPITGQLTGSPSPTPFNLRLDRARDVAVVIGDNWTQLSKGSDGLWSGEVDISQFVGKQNKCVLCANMDDNEATFSTLLEYSIAN